MTTSLELGLDTFGDTTVDLEGRRLSHPQVIRNLVEQAVLAVTDGSTLGAAQIALAPPPPIARPPMAEHEPPQSLPQVERDALVRALDQTGGNVSRAARLLGISRDTMRYRMGKHGLELAGTGIDGG